MLLDGPIEDEFLEFKPATATGAGPLKAAA
jgi:hypothetical protein